MKDSHVKYYAFVAISVLWPLSYGLNWQFHTVYNVQPLHSLLNAERLSPGMSALTLLYVTHVVPLLNNTSIFLLSLISIKGLTFVLLYQISKDLLRDEKSAVVSALLFLLAGVASHGLVHNGLWGPTVLFPAYLSAVCSLFALLTIIRRYFALAGILLSLSVLFHPLYGATFFSWIFLGVALCYFRNSSDRLKILVFCALIPLCVIGLNYYAFSSPVKTQMLAETTPVEWWYNYNVSMDPDDVLLSWTFENYGYFMVPFLVGAIILTARNFDKSILSFLFVGSVLMLVICLAIEFLHSLGFFVEGVSEAFVYVQLRRGMWALMLFALLTYVREWKLLMSFFSKNNQVTVSVFSAVLYISAPISLTISACALWLYKSKKTLPLVIIVACVALSCLTLISGETFTLRSEITRFMSIVICILSLLVGLFFPKARRFAPTVYLFLFILCCSLFARELITGRIFRSTTLLNFDNLPIEENMQRLIQHNIVYEGSDVEQSLVDFLSKEINNLDAIQIPLSKLTYSSEKHFSANIFISRAEVQDFFVNGKNYNKDMFFSHFDSMQNAYDFNDLSRLADNGIGVYVVDKERIELKERLFHVDGSCYVYSTKKIKQE
jgi:hypothetical protein